MSWINLCSIDEIDVGEMREFRHDGRRIVVYHLPDGFYATDNICPHEFALLSEGWLENAVIECPLHGALFDVKSGRVERGPACSDLKTHAVKAEYGRVWCRI